MGRSTKTEKVLADILLDDLFPTLKIYTRVSDVINEIRFGTVGSFHSYVAIVSCLFHSLMTIHTLLSSLGLFKHSLRKPRYDSNSFYSSALEESGQLSFILFRQQGKRFPHATRWITR